jgi:hypothetical protein
MLDILNTLSGQDLGYLKIVANAWGIEIKAPDAYKARIQLSSSMNNPDLIREIYESFPEEPRNAFDALLENDGVIPWVKFARDFGEIQVMGSAKRDRERPDLNPKTPTEFLWYRAFIGRAFLSTETEPQEFAYIPEEIFNLLKPIQIQQKQIPGRLATEKEFQVVIPAMDRIIDDICTGLAALRNGFEIEGLTDYIDISLPFLKALLVDMKFLSDNGSLDAELVRHHLELSRSEALLQIFNHWLESVNIDELFSIPDLLIEGKPDHNPKLARKFLLEQISSVPNNKWWNLDSFIAYIHQTNPDFQRPAGNYDSWYIKSKETETYLNGFENWNKIDGAYIHFIITGPLHWFGLIDLGTTLNNNSIKSFRLSKWYAELINNQPPKDIKPDEPKITMSGNGKLTVPFRFTRSSRYQISRFCEWMGLEKGTFHFQITIDSLNRAKSQSLKVNHLIRIIQPALNHPFPPKLKTALENWENNGAQAFINQVELFQVSDPAILQMLQKSSMKKFIISILNPTTAIINSNGIEKIKQAMLEFGYLVQ